MRLAFSVAVNVEPDVLIVDEALAVGDTAFQLKCVERLEHLTQERRHAAVRLARHGAGQVVLPPRALPRARPPQGAGSARRHHRALRARHPAGGRRAGREPGHAEALRRRRRRHRFRNGRGAHRRAPRSARPGTTRTTSAYGDDLIFDVDVEFADNVAQPCLSVIVHDRQARELGGAFFPIDKPAADRRPLPRDPALRTRMRAWARVRGRSRCGSKTGAPGSSRFRSTSRSARSSSISSSPTATPTSRSSTCSSVRARGSSS